MHGSLRWLFLLLLASLKCASWAASDAECAISDALLQPSACGQGCRKETLEALRAIYRDTNGSSMWNFSDKNKHTDPKGNWSDDSCIRCSSGDQILPSYCCWEGVSCCQQPHTFKDSTECDPYSVTALQPQSGNLTGAFEKLVPHITVLHQYGLQYLDLGRNFITGSIPPTIANLSNMKALLLASNNLTGTVPPELSQLTQLQQLDLEFNFLSGRLDQTLCVTTNNSLMTLYLRANNFTGPLDLSKCRQLQIADVQENGFYGPLPVNGSNAALLVLRARMNEFDGPLSEDVWTLPRLIQLDLTNNSLSGELPQTATPSNQLNRLYLGGNNFSGSVPQGFVDITQVTDLDLGDNPWISGTLPNLQWMTGLVTLIISNTRIRGTIPTELGYLPYLQTIDLHNTLMTCCHTEDEAVQQLNNDTLLPSFLVLDSSSPQPPILDMRLNSRDAILAGLLNTGGNMTCPTVRRSPDVPYAIGSSVLRPANLTNQNWFVDPEYFWFKNCDCRTGFEADPSYNSSYQRVWCAGNHVNDPSCVQMHVKQCVLVTPQNSPLLSKQAIAALAIAGLASCLLLIMLVSLTVNLCIARTGKIRRQLNWWHKHLAGMPKSGKMSIVVTDIEGYSDLFKRCPELMYKALTLHNNVIRRAKYEHCGSTVQQEGDSYTIVFHDAFDAVAFCLQVQQALLEVCWPEGLMEAGDGDSSNSSNGASSGRAGRRIRLGQLEAMSSLFSGGPSSWIKKSRGNSMLPRPRGSAPLPPANSIADGPPTAGNSVAMPSVHLTPSTRRISRTRMLDLFRGSTPAGGGLFNGLRVRMGVATGVVVVDAQTDSSSALANILNSLLCKMAVDVSDAGNGGQILLDQETFIRIKEELHPLGAVDANGINYNKLAQRRSLCHLLFLGAFCASRHRKPVDSDEAAVLDMGEYEVPALPPKAASMKQHAASATRKLLTAGLLPVVSPFTRRSVEGGNNGRDGLKDGVGGHLGPRQRVYGHEVTGQPPCTTLDRQQTAEHLTIQRSSTLPGAMPVDYKSLWGGTGSGAAAAPAAGSLTEQCGVDSRRPRVRLVQILAPSLVGRAFVWGSKMSLKSSWVCTDPPYFEAPGALSAPLGNTGPQRAVSVGEHVRAASLSVTSPTGAQQQQQQQGTGSGRGLDVTCSPLVSPTDSFSGQQQLLAMRSSSAGSAGIHGSIRGMQQIDEQQQQQGLSPFDIEAQTAPQQSLGPDERQSSAASSAAPPSAVPLSSPIPPVTLVFLSVEGSKVFGGSRRRALVKEVHSQLSLLLMEALRHVAGGYMCRMQEGDLKYMVAFSSAASAVEWCLLVQEAAMFLNWPDERWQKLRVSQLASEYNSRGQLVFRGPRLKMGVCEGVPKTIIPDHLGRADYHGSSVNQAARYMDAAAHGGQVACEAELALAVLQQWQGLGHAATDAVAAGGVGGEEAFFTMDDLVSRTHSAPPNAAATARRTKSPAAAVAAAITIDQQCAAAVDAVDDLVVRANTSWSLDTLLEHSKQQQQQTAKICETHDRGLSCAPSCNNGPQAAGPAVVDSRSNTTASADSNVSTFCRLLPHSDGHELPASSAAIKASVTAAGLKSDTASKHLFGLAEVPRVQVEVQILNLGSFRFKGNPAPMDMVNITLTSLAGRQQYYPGDPPKGKGNRIAAKSGVVATGAASLSTLAQQYKARVPDHILHSGVAASRKFSGQHLRSASMPVRRGDGFGTAAGVVPGQHAGGANRLGSPQSVSLIPRRHTSSSSSSTGPAGPGFVEQPGVGVVTLNEGPGVVGSKDVVLHLGRPVSAVVSSSGLSAGEVLLVPVNGQVLANGNQLHVH